ncbi:MAG: hypothetical protein IPH52_13580 [Leptospiraceae bacterium]|nr:hypothetical protein [Leptospiraceae bacterium]
MKPKEILALSEEELFLKLKENVERKVLQKYSILTEELKKQIEFEFTEIRKTGLGREILLYFRNYKNRSNSLGAHP